MPGGLRQRQRSSEPGGGPGVPGQPGRRHAAAAVEHQARVGPVSEPAETLIVKSRRQTVLLIAFLFVLQHNYSQQDAEEIHRGGLRHALSVSLLKALIAVSAELYVSTCPVSRHVVLMRPNVINL